MDNRGSDSIKRGRCGGISAINTSADWAAYKWEVLK